MVLAGILGAVAGAAGGYFLSKNLHRFTGGACPLLCNPRIAIPYFAFIGVVVALEIMR